LKTKLLPDDLGEFRTVGTVRPPDATLQLQVLVEISMTVTVKSKTPLVVPQAIQRLAGIKSGDLLEVRASARTITITAVERTYKPTRAEWAAIRRGEAALARGESLSLAEFANDMDSRRRKASLKGSRKVSR
jgi:bifunctional DNA-binding transcriptional regulator/antitoxin component of YhaV-PrlF toxin-antitoxin module